MPCSEHAQTVGVVTQHHHKELGDHCIASTLRENPNLIADKGGPIIKTRYEKIMKLFVSQDLASSRKLRTQEEYQEREALLAEIWQRTTDFMEVADVYRARDNEKQAGIDALGLVARRLAMQSMTMSSGDVDSSDDSSASNDDEVSAPVFCSQVLLAEASVNEATSVATPIPAQSSRSKWTRVPSSKKTITKREKLNSVMVTITTNIDNINTDSDSSSSALFEYRAEKARLDQNN